MRTSARIFAPVAFVLASSLGESTAGAQPATLVRDIHTQNQPFAGLSPSNPSHLTVLGNQVLFSARTASDGIELWKTDGTTAGTALVKDIAPGISNSSPESLAVLGSRLFFRAEDFSLGPELWTSDGTAAGTQPVRSIQIGGSYPDELTPAGNFVYFAATDSDHGRELWRSDGTDAGTSLVKDIVPGTGDSGPSQLTAVGNEVFFFVTSGNAGDLWASDVSTLGTVLVHSFISRDNAVHPVAVGASLYFRACDSVTGCGLWRADASSHAVQRLTTAIPTVLFGFGGALYFGANDGTHGEQLWRSDGTTAGTAPLKDVGVASFAVSRGGLYFVGVSSSPPGVGLWKTDGTSGGTSAVFAFAESTSNVFPLVDVQGTLFFFLSELGGGALNYSLWRSDGTGAGTSALRSFASPGLPGYSTDSMKALGSTLIFAAEEPPSEASHGRELWRSDGTAAGTVLLRDVSTEPIGSTPFFTGTNEGSVFFQADDGTHGRELWKTDGGPQGTTLVKDISARDSFPVGFTALGPRTVFSAFDEAHGVEPWVTDGSDSGTSILLDINGTQTSSGWSQPRDFTVWNGSAVFTAFDGSRLGLWKTDATPAGTVPVAPGGPSPWTPYVSFMGALFFGAQSPDRATFGLWMTDGTASGTLLVQTLNAFNPNQYPRYLTVSGSLLYFEADGPVHDRELWVSDGTAPGTRPVSPTGAITNVFDLTDVNGRLFYSANGGLWMTDGTAAGTVLVKAGVQPDTLVAVAGVLFFVGQDPAHGRELWKSDGTAAGTAIVQDIRPGISGSLPIRLTASGSLLVFAASDDTHGMELWRSDGTAAGTFLVQDIHPGPGSSISDTGWTIRGSRLYFGADDGEHGLEPWVLELDALGQPSSCGPDPYTLCLNGGRFSVRVAWATAGGVPTPGARLPLTADTGAFWFFSANNIELVVKVVDGRAVNGHFWAFVGALTDVAYTMTLVDTATGSVRTYTNPQGRLASYADTSAF